MKLPIFLVLLVSLITGCGGESQARLTQPPKPITTYDGQYTVEVTLDTVTKSCDFDLEFEFLIKDGEVLPLPGDPTKVNGILNVNTGKITGTVVDSVVSWNFDGGFNADKVLSGEWIDSEGCRGKFKQVK